jgi:hypothetical protein
LPEISEIHQYWIAAGSQRENSERKKRKKDEKRYESSDDNGDDMSRRPSGELSQYWRPTSSQGENGGNDDHHSTERTQYWTPPSSLGGNGENGSDDATRHSSMERSEDWASTGSQEGNSESGDDEEEDASHYSSIEQTIYVEEFIIDEEQPQRVRDERSFTDWIIGRNKQKNAKPEKKRKLSKKKREVSEKKREVLDSVIIEQIAPRQIVSADLDRVFQLPQSMAELEEKLQETKSTKSEICGALGVQRGSHSLARALTRIIKQDTMTLLNQLRQVLDEIDIEIIDDVKMEDRLSLWRNIINRAQRELPELRYSIEPFIEFLIKLHSPGSLLELAATKMEITQDRDELWKSIDRIIDRLQTTSTSLNSNMALLESRRSIDEAHAVARLTELAFIFIPMSFAASVFGMQIEPFADPVPISNFFVVAIVVTSFAYLMRMAMRSHWLMSIKTAVKHDVRKYAARNGQSVPPRSLPMLLIFQSIGSRLGTSISSTLKLLVKRTRLVAKKLWAVFGFMISFVLLNGVASAIPIGMLWTRELDSGIRDAVSIAIAFIIIFVVGVPFWRRSNPLYRNALPNLIMDGLRRAPWWARMALIYLTFAAAFIGMPLALIWTRPLAIGIKSGLTVGVVMMTVILMTLVTAIGVGRRAGRNFN